MKKKIIITLMMLALVAALAFSLVACSNTNPADFINAMSKAKEMTTKTYDLDGEVMDIVSYNEKGEFITKYMCAKYLGSELYLYANNGTWRKAKITKYNDIYTEAMDDILTSNALGDVLGSEFEITKELFIKRGSYWHVNFSGLIWKKSAFKTYGNMIEIYSNDGESLFKTASIALKADITLPLEANKAVLVNAADIWR